MKELVEKVFHPTRLLNISNRSYRYLFLKKLIYNYLKK